MINYIKNKSNLPDLSTSIYFTILAIFSYDSPGGLTRGLTVLKLDGRTQEEAQIFLLLTNSLPTPRNIVGIFASVYNLQCPKGRLLRVPAPPGDSSPQVLIFRVTYHPRLDSLLFLYLRK